MMSATFTDRPAFPVTAGHEVYSIGMTLRDWFAGMALQALIAKSKFMDSKGVNGEPMTAEDMAQFRFDIAASSLAYADAMIYQSQKQDPRDA